MFTNLDLKLKLEKIHIRVELVKFIVKNSVVKNSSNKSQKTSNL